MEKKNPESDTLYILAKEMLERDPDFAYVRQVLSEKCADPELVEEILDQARKVYYAKKRKSGTAKLGIGSVLLVVGFVLTVINFHSNESFTFVMYGFTSAGLLILFWGLYDIFG
ncbi:MAG TPA: hypothetical protein PLQ93_13030 [Bacteroidia bacterium]|nr:hypothetical protein [Bacteroidia bacterium]